MGHSLVAKIATFFATLFVLTACWQTEPRPHDDVADGRLTSEELTVQFIDDYGLDVAATTRKSDDAVSMNVLAGCHATVIYDGTTATLVGLDEYIGYVELTPDSAGRKVEELCEHPADFDKD